MKAKAENLILFETAAIPGWVNPKFSYGICVNKKMLTRREWSNAFPPVRCFSAHNLKKALCRYAGISTRMQTIGYWNPFARPQPRKNSNFDRCHCGDTTTAVLPPHCGTIQLPTWKTWIEFQLWADGSSSRDGLEILANRTIVPVVGLTVNE